MSRRSEPKALLYAIVFGLALLLHLPIALLVVLLMEPTDEALAETQEFDPIQLVEEDDLTREEKELPVVSLDKPEEETPPPEEATVLDRYNQKVDKEMVRKRDGREPGLPVKQPQQQAERQPPAQQPAEAKEPPKETAPPEVAKTEEPEPEEPAADLPEDPEGAKARVDDAKADPTEMDPGKKAPEVAKTEDSGKGEPDLDPSKILPNLENAMGQGGNGAKDYLEVAEGDRDLLNRKETRYWAFFDRVKTSVRRQWEPNSVYRSHDPRGQIYGVEDRLTILHVTLRGDGSLHKMYVEKPSGLAFLDNEAMRAFRVAQPFSNPPEALKDDKGLISFRFGFMFEIHSRGGRIIRYRR